MNLVRYYHKHLKRPRPGWLATTPSTQSKERGGPCPQAPKLGGVKRIVAADMESTKEYAQYETVSSRKKDKSENNYISPTTLRPDRESDGILKYLLGRFPVASNDPWISAWYTGMTNGKRASVVANKVARKVLQDLGCPDLNLTL
jgi:hypothetical protein